jgi:hypothetical protein
MPVGGLFHNPLRAPQGTTPGQTQLQAPIAQTFAATLLLLATLRYGESATDFTPHSLGVYRRSVCIQCHQLRRRGDYSVHAHGHGLHRPHRPHSLPRLLRITYSRRSPPLSRSYACTTRSHNLPAILTKPSHKTVAPRPTDKHDAPPFHVTV